MADIQKEMIWRQGAIIRSITVTDGTAEGLRMSGCIFRTKRQMPVVDCEHSIRPTVRMIYGSIRNLRVERGQLLGDLRWATDEASQQVRQKYSAGDLVLTLDADVYERDRNGIATKWAPLAAVLTAG